MSLAGFLVFVVGFIVGFLFVRALINAVKARKAQDVESRTLRTQPEAKPLKRFRADVALLGNETDYAIHGVGHDEADFRRRIAAQWHSKIEPLRILRVVAIETEQDVTDGSYR